jgi:hypothetical protein
MLRLLTRRAAEKSIMTPLTFALLPKARDKFIVIVMAPEIHRLRQVTASVFVMLALCVSSISACACAHHYHSEKVEVKIPSCHRPADTEETRSKVSADASCECILQAPAKVFVKSEKLKLEKQTIASASENSNSIPVLTGHLYRSAGFYSPRIFVPEPFHNLSPGRAPPRL